MLEIINIVLPAFSVILIGYLFGKLRNINVSPLIDISLFIGVPALIFVSLIQNEIVIIDALKIWVAAVTIMVGTLVVAWIAFRLIRQKHSGLYLPISVMNTMYVPFPIIFLVYGSSGMVAAVLFNIPYILFLFSFGTYLMSNRRWRENLREVLKQPVLYASVLGLLMNFLNVKVPVLLINTLDFISLMAIPVVLFVLGCSLSRLRVKNLPTTFLASFFRMGIGLGIGFLVVTALDITGIFRSVVILVSAMPAAVNSAILAAKYDNEAHLVSSVVFVTTLVSIFTIPLLLKILG